MASEKVAVVVFKGGLAEGHEDDVVVMLGIFVVDPSLDVVGEGLNC